MKEEGKKKHIEKPDKKRQNNSQPKIITYQWKQRKWKMETKEEEFHDL